MESDLDLKMCYLYSCWVNSLVVFVLGRDVITFVLWHARKTYQSPRGAIEKRPSQKLWRFDVTGFLVLMCKKPIAPLDKG